jgi:hypothetical protein
MATGDDLAAGGARVGSRRPREVEVEVEVVVELNLYH